MNFSPPICTNFYCFKIRTDITYNRTNLTILRFAKSTVLTGTRWPLQSGEDC